MRAGEMSLLLSPSVRWLKCKWMMQTIGKVQQQLEHLTRPLEGKQESLSRHERPLCPFLPETKQHDLSLLRSLSLTHSCCLHGDYEAHTEEQVYIV